VIGKRVDDRPVGAGDVPDDYAVHGSGEGRAVRCRPTMRRV
jgi:hypothetical protein